MLSAWLGTEQALRCLDDQIVKMHRHWPFFRTHVDLVEMVLTKTDSEIVEYYKNLLVDTRLHFLGMQLRQRLSNLKDNINLIKRQAHLLDQEPLIMGAINLRNPYLDPLHYLQAEILRRLRFNEEHQDTVQQVLQVTIAGIAAGMRNTG